MKAVMTLEEGTDNKLLLQSKHREHRRHKIYGKEKAEIASLVERYGRVQSLMKYVNSDTLKESYNKQPKGKAVGVDGITKEQYGRRKHRESACQNEEVFL